MRKDSNLRKQLILLVLILICSMMAACGESPAEEPQDVGVVVRPGQDKEKPIYWDSSYSFEERAADLVSRMTLTEKVEQLKAGRVLEGKDAAAPAIPRLGVPSYYWWSEALHGVARTGAEKLTNQEGTFDGGTTSYTDSLGMGTTWNPELIREMASQISDEARALTYEYGKELSYWSPTVNLSRDPRWGRAEESVSEDPYLTGAIGTEFVLGMQEGEDETYLKAIATPKHYMANNNEGGIGEGGRFYTSSEFDDWTLREYYSVPFATLIQDADAQSIMMSYNRVNGTPSSASLYMMTNLLRDTWGFTGYTVTDCWMFSHIIDPYQHNWNSDVVKVVGYAMSAGLDLNCGDGTLAGTAVEAIELGYTTEGELDQALLRLFTARIATGEFDRDGVNPYVDTEEDNLCLYDSEEYSAKNQILAEDHVATALQTSEEAIVLLKNENDILPLGKDAKIVVIGEGADRIELGDYSRDDEVGIDQMTTPYEAFLALNSNVEFIEPVENPVYSEKTKESEKPLKLSAEEAASIRNADAVIVCVGTTADDSKEDSDRATLTMPRNQGAIVKQIAGMNSHTVAYIHAVSQVTLTEFKDEVEGLLWSTYNGQEQGTAIAKVIFGEVNPSGHLPFTWYKDESQLDPSDEYRIDAEDGRNGRTYMYFTGEQDYEFGYGLSYTEFAYSNLQISAAEVTPDDILTVTIDVTNTGDVAGQEVVQMYLESPRAGKMVDGGNGTTAVRPRIQLKGLDKIFLEPGETKTVTLELPVEDLWFWYEDISYPYVDEETGIDTEVIHEGHQVYDQGTWTLYVGPSSNVEGEKVLADTFELSGELTKEIMTVNTNPDVVVVDAAMGDNTFSANATAVYNDQSYARDAEFAYSSADPEVAVVDENGTVTVVGDGVTTITATCGGQSSSFPVVGLVSLKLQNLYFDDVQYADFSTRFYRYQVEIESYEDLPEVTYRCHEAFEVTEEKASKENKYTHTIILNYKDSKSTYYIQFVKK